jgi:antitoxin MazE
LLFRHRPATPDLEAASAMKTRLVRIGNSRGIRIPKPLLEELGAPEEVELHIQDGALLVTPVVDPRAGWAEAVTRHGPAPLLDAPTPTAFDEAEWSW